MKHRFTSQKHNHGFALVITLVILSLLVVMAVAFLLSSRTERGTARSVADKVKADLAAQTAVNGAIARLFDNLNTYPDSATTWEQVKDASGNAQYQGTTIYYRDVTPEANAGIASPLHALPLISGAQPVAIPDPPYADANARETPLRGALPVLDKTNSFDLNQPRSASDTQGWIGTPPGSTRPEFRGEWIDLKDSDGKVTSRCAYWMEDESFKVNANLMGNTLRQASSLGNDPSQIPLQGMLATIGLNTSLANPIFNFRSNFPASHFFEYRALDQVDPQQTTLAEGAKFVATIFSGATNLSRSGTKRINLNQVVSTSNSAGEIRTQLDQIIKTIKYHLPNFAQRFYRAAADLNSLDVVSTGSAPVDTYIYLNKVAANIRDYIDTDSQPTVVNRDLSVQIGAPPSHPFEAVGGGTAGSNEVIAIGKERVPMAQEYALRVRQITFAPSKGVSATYKIAIDHYVEFWNMTNQNINVSDLGPNPFLLIADQPRWDAGTFPGIPESPSRDIKAYLKDAKIGSSAGAPFTSFPAGSVTVITTDPQPLPALAPDSSRICYVPIPDDGANGLRTYTGQTDKKNSSDQLRLNIVTRTTSSTDYETEIALGNDLGILDSDWGAGPVTSIISINDDTPGVRFDTTKYHFRGGSLKGNSSGVANATTGDPRTMAEQLRFDLNGSTTANDKTRYFTSGLNDNAIPANSTLTAPDSNFVDPKKWPDYSQSLQTAADAPAVIANAQLTSIGQLGDIFDPVRIKGDSGNIQLSRSGGRTLKIGQPERVDATTNPLGLWDGNSNSRSREWTSWRLTDFFATTDALQLDGRVNINGATRDNGVALKAAIYGYDFQSTPDSDPTLSGKPFDADPTSTNDRVNELIRQMQARLRNDPTTSVYGGRFGTTVGPFAERGELSEMPMFNTGTDSESPVSGVMTTNVYDRGREELFRRLVELTTTRGNIFTVYAVGQSLIPQTSGNPIIASTSQIKVTFRIDPQWNAGMPTDPFDPNSTARFAKPDRYAIKILYAGD